MGAATLDATTFREVMARFLRALRAHRDELNSLNVYPVPDGDTGTNMLLTQEAVEQALAGMDGAPLRDLGETVSRASLMGARGNSGVILSQILRGLCARLCRDDAPRPEALVEALAHAAEEARRAVAQPVEGTVLTVIADAARAAAGALAEGGGLVEVARAAHQAARESVARTRETLPALRAAGVVDAGGKGILLLLDALDSALSGEPMAEEVGPLGPVGTAEPEAREEALEFRYEVQYLLEAGDRGVPDLERRLGPLGDSLVVVGGEGTYKVHIHTNEPGRAVEESLDTGRPRQIQVTDLQEAVDAHCLMGQARAVGLPQQQVALVAVAEGDGLAAIFRSLGAVVVTGGPGRNPSVAELVEAIDAAPAPAVVVLPNHRNVVPAAERAAKEAAKRAWVVPTRSVPEGVAAATAANPLAVPEENLEGMRHAAEATAAGEVTRAVRDAETPAGAVREGDLLGVSGGEVVVVGGEPGAVAAELAGRLRRREHEILTLFVGRDPSEEEAAAVEHSLRRALPDLEVEVHRGGQPAYDYLIGLE